MQFIFKQFSNKEMMLSLCGWLPQLMLFLCVSVTDYALAASADDQSASVPAAAIEAQKQYITPLKSENDPRSYRYLQLPNQLNVLLISDAHATNSLAALSVGVGTNQNPAGKGEMVPVLAKVLLEGSEQYPEANNYRQYLAQHGGSYQTSVGSERTTYYFDVENESFSTALGRFAQFFSAPLFAAKFIAQERAFLLASAQVQPNNAKTLEMDVYSDVFNPLHPASKFADIDFKSLANKNDDFRQELIDFYKAQYSADKMNLVICGPESLDSLEAYVSANFSSIPQHETVPASAAPKLFAPGDLPETVEIKTLDDGAQLVLNFPVPIQKSSYSKKPYQFIANVLKSQGAGSLHSFLKQLGWATQIDANLNVVSRSDGIFQISIELSSQGVRARNQIVSLVFYTINQMKTFGVSAWRYSEMQEIGDLNFIYADNQSSLDFVRNLAEMMFIYEPRAVLRNKTYFSAFDEKLIRKSLGYLNPEALLLVFKSSEVAPYRVSSLFSVPFSQNHQVPEVLDLKPAVKQKLFFADRNFFIPRRLAVKSSSMLVGGEESKTSHPELIFETKAMRLWFAQDRFFNVPKAEIDLRINLPLVGSSLGGSVNAQLFAQLINDQLTEYAYPAKLAGLDYTLSANTRGLELRLKGFSSRQSLLLSKLIDAISRGNFDPDRFAIVKKALIAELRNKQKLSPQQILLRRFSVLLSEPSWNDDEQLTVLESITYESFNRFASNLLLDARIEMLVYGNYFRQEALKLAVLVDSNLLARQTGREMPPAKVFGLNENAVQPWLFETPVNTASSLVGLWVPVRSLAANETAHLQVIHKLLADKFRANMCAGAGVDCIATAAIMPVRQLNGVVFLAQNSSKDEQQMIKEVDEFLAQHSDFSPEDVESGKRAVLKKLVIVPHSFSAQGEKFWRSMWLGEYDFTQRNQVAGEVEKITVSSINEFYKSLFQQKNRRLWLSGKHLDSVGDFQKIESVATFRAAQKSYLIN